MRVIELVGFEGFYGSQWLREGCVAVRYLTPYFGYIILPHVDLAGAMPCPKKVQKKYAKKG